jgi:hypothetical protein
MAQMNMIRAEVRRLVRCVPFRPFSLNMENGDRVVIKHAENIAFDPSDAARPDFAVVSSDGPYHSSFAAVSSIALLDHGEPAA